MIITDWKFSTDNKNFENVTVPHTWSVDERFQNFMGKCFYKTVINIDFISDFNILKFESAYRDTQVFVNGKLAFSHYNSGYTPFEGDITDFIKIGENEIFVTVDNSFSEAALPWKDQFDWNCDGGLIRNVYFTQNKSTDIKSCFVYTSDLQPIDNLRAGAYINVEAQLFDSVKDYEVTVSLLGKKITAITDSYGKIKANIYFDNIEMWSPENPVLYDVKINEKIVRTGVREISVFGNSVYLNSKAVKLKGVEWMPGSCPDYGMAEPQDFAIKNLEMLKDIGCNFTRFHWQQPDFVYDWCDENGIMVQEEIPYWGHPKESSEQQLIVAKQQSDEMFCAHRNHPSIVCWGVGNELGGGEASTIRYVYEAISYFKSLDKTRLVNFVSNTLHRVGSLDATMFGDICMWNEYIGLWYPELSDVDAVIKDLIKLCGNKPFMVTEAGLCEPAFKGGDERRCEIYEERERIYRANDLAGWVYFSLNDYRTHMGEEGDGKLCRRIHGSTDLNGVKKPSYFVLKKLIGEKSVI